MPCGKSMWMGSAGLPEKNTRELAPESTKEAQALVNLTKKELFCRTVSYHSSGGVIYWAFGQQGELASRTQTFAKRIAAVTGYEPDGNYEELDPAGYKDWALLKMGIPSLTIEIGRADSPLPAVCLPENPPGKQRRVGRNPAGYHRREKRLKETIDKYGLL